jgi:sulfite exporter TauE/SafE
VPWDGAGLQGAMLVAGLASGVHCVGMCGGIVGAFAAHRVVAIHEARRGAEWPRQLAFNAGRIASYTAAGGAAGLAGGAAAYMSGALPVQTALYVLANVMLVLIGLYVAGAGGLLRRAERFGAPLWRRIQPLAARLLGARTLPQAFGAGAVWGWLPCGLVYGALTVAALAGSPGRGALVMLAFGLGTLPNLMAAGLAAARLRAWSANPRVRLAAGAVVLGFGAFGLAHAAGVADGIRRGLLCLT